MGDSRYFSAQGAPNQAPPRFDRDTSPHRDQQNHGGAVSYGYAVNAPAAGHARNAQYPGQQPPSYGTYPGNAAPYVPYNAPTGFSGPPPPRPPSRRTEGEARSKPLGGVMHGLGAVLSVALIFGAGAWMWQLMQRDVAGVPVVRALEGPSRVAPDDPGGRQTAHQGLSVNELAAAQEEARSDSIMLAPPPLELPREDLAPARSPDRQPEQAPDAMDQPIPVALQRELSLPPSGEALGFASPTRRAVESSPRPPARSADGASQSRAAAASAPSGGSSDADDLAASVANSVAAGLSSARDIDVDPASIGPGTRLVQLGAYDDIAAARAAWDQLARRFSPLLDDRGRVIEAAHSGGSVFYRLRAHGFSDERDARRFCAALVDQQIDCIPVLIR